MKDKKAYKCILFDTQLSADFEQFNQENCSFEVEIFNHDHIPNKKNSFLLIEKLKSLCSILLKNGVDIVLCQKVLNLCLNSLNLKITF